jgi:hypothetical protein
MIKIPQKFITKGVEATEAAKKAVAKIENSVKQEVITPSKLVREPDSDLFEKASYMTKDEFWNDYKNAIMNESNRHRLGLPVSERFADDALVFDEKTGRVKQRIINYEKPFEKVTETHNFADDGRSLESISTYHESTIGTGKKWERVSDPKDENVREYDILGDQKILSYKRDVLPNGNVKSVKYENGKPVRVFNEGTGYNSFMALSSDGTIEKYTKNGERLI